MLLLVLAIATAACSFTFQNSIGCRGRRTIGSSHRFRTTIVVGVDVVGIVGVEGAGDGQPKRIGGEIV